MKQYRPRSIETMDMYIAGSHPAMMLLPTIASRSINSIASGSINSMTQDDYDDVNLLLENATIEVGYDKYMPSLSEAIEYDLSLTESGQKSTKFAILYREADAALYVKHFGRGLQGSAILLQRPSGQLVVRKKLRWPYCPSFDYEEVVHHRPHRRIPRLLGYRHYFDATPRGGPSITMLFEYCNGGSINTFIRNALSNHELYPEVLIWRMLSHILECYDDLHHANPAVTHGDLVPSNVFLNWHSDSILPDFFLGDWGGSKAHKVTSEARAEMAQCIAKDLLEVADNVNFLVEEYWNCPVSNENSDLSLDSITPEISTPLGCEDRWMSYSRSLRLIYDRIRLLGEAIEAQSQGRSPEMYDLKPIRNIVDSQRRSREALVSMVCPPPWHQSPLPPSPKFYDFMQDLVGESGVYPPGPWDIATMDRSNGGILEVSSGGYCRRVP